MLRRTLPLLVLGLLFRGPGCFASSIGPNPGAELSSLNEQFGGFATSDKKPAFDDYDLLAQVDNDKEFDDPILQSAAVGTLSADDEAGLYHMRIVWGRLCFDTTVTEATDWSGSLSVNKGAEITRREIRFELGQDYVHPRSDRKLTEWTSRTSIHNDGIAVDIVVEGPKPVLDSTTVIDIRDENDLLVTVLVVTTYPVVDPVEVVFETGPYRSTFTLAEISALDIVIYSGYSDAVAIHGLKLDHRPCPGGMLTGTRRVLSG